MKSLIIILILALSVLSSFTKANASPWYGAEFQIYLIDDSKVIYSILQEVDSIWVRLVDLGTLNAIGDLVYYSTETAVYGPSSGLTPTYVTQRFKHSCKTSSGTRYDFTAQNFVGEVILTDSSASEYVDLDEELIAPFHYFCEKQAPDALYSLGQLHAESLRSIGDGFEDFRMAMFKYFVTDEELNKNGIVFSYLQGVGIDNIDFESILTVE